MDERDLPTGRLGRFARLASTGLRAGVGALLDQDARAAAMHTAEVLGTLRGLAAKVGQMASYVDGVIPEGQRDHYELAMKGLRAATPRSSAAEVRALIVAELGDVPEALFAEWGDAPIASASIGQVHRARLHDGRAVAVKVQHPGVAAAVESDLSNGSILTTMASNLGMRRHDPDAVFAVIKARFREELDYAHEADNQRAFAEHFAGDRHIHVPAVVGERSSARVLTMGFLEGRSFDEAVAAPRAEREAWARTLWRYVFGAILAGGRFNADPHPGNYLFMDDGAVGVLDFGCVQRIPEGNRVHAWAMHRAAIARDEAGFRRHLALMMGAKPGRMEQLCAEYVRAAFRPLFESPFHMTRPYAASLVEGMRHIAKESRSIPDAEFFTMPSEMTFMNRLQFGFYSLLARLDVTVDYAAIEREILATLPA
ncbi:MAG: Ubiquinone biosynthesis monooxygenase UbiB [Myxococcaceae bacterium]|nr:Ubiquinone biosynthesis monooxygenase UbiB [Myxococcaceae bacterium]